MRRTAQEITPHLYLGPSESSRNLPALHSTGISTILIISSAAEEAAAVLKPRFPHAFQYHTLRVEERTEQNMIMLVPHIRTLIDGAINDGCGRVLVHDDGGISRAPAVVILCVGLGEGGGRH